MTDHDGCEFGGFVLERAQRRLWRSNGTQVELTPRLFNALLFFVDHPGQLLSKETLLRGIWPGLVVEENNLSQVVAALRRALGDDTQGSRFIQTVPRQGFRFVQAVSPCSRPAPGSLEPMESPASARHPPARRRTLRWMLAGGSAAAICAVGWLAWKRMPSMLSEAALPGSLPSAPSASRLTLAVLPFKPVANESREELLELGMADSLISRLSTVPGLVVRSTGSVGRYAGADQDPLRAAKELDVTWVVDGSLQRRGDMLRTTARLLNASTGLAAWSDAFDNKITSVFEVQDQIASRVMRALLPVLDARRSAPSSVEELGGTRSTAAYELYLAARWRAQGGRASEVDKGIALLNQALSLDPNYAMAWVELAQVYRRKLFNSDGLASEVFEPGNAALQRALILVPGLAAAHAGIGFSHYWFTFDWQAAEQAFDRALALNPNTAAAHWGKAGLLLNQGRLEDGFHHIQTARSLDPMSPVFNTVEASYLLGAGRHEEARVRLTHSLDIAPNLWLTHLGFGLLDLAEQRKVQGIASLRNAVALSDATRARAVLGVELARQGQADEARSIQAQLLAQSKSRYVLPSSIASLHAALGEPQEALSALDLGLSVRDVRMAYLKDDDHWTSLHAEPRFLALLKALGLDGFRPGLVPL